MGILLTLGAEPDESLVDDKLGYATKRLLSMNAEKGKLS